MAFNEKKYKDIFEKRHGSGSFDSGLSSARNIGALKAQAEFAKSEYKKRRSEAEERAKKAQEEADANQTIYGDMPAYYSRELQDNAKKQGRGGYQPTYENKLKEKAAVKKGKEKAKENKLVPDLETMTPYQKQLRGFEPSWDKPKKEKKKKGVLGGIFDKLKKSEIGKVAKATEDFINPFDKVKAKDAVTNYINSDKSDTFKEVARGANRAVDSASLGIMSNLDKKVNDRTPYYTSQRKFGDGGGKDMFSTGLGYLVPGVGAYKALNATKAGKGLTQYGSQGLKQRLGSEAVKGSAIGAAMSGAEVGVREGLNPDDQNWKQNLGYVGLGTAAGAIADPALYGAGRAIGNGLSRFAKGDVPTFSGGPSESVLNQLRPSRAPMTNSPSNNLYDDLIMGAKERRTSIEPPQLSRLNETAAAQEAPTLRPGRDFEPIESAPNEGGDFARVADELLDTQRQASGDMSSFRGKVDRKPVKESNGMFSNLRTQFIDDVAPLETIEKQIAGKVDSAENSLYKQARLFKGSPEKAHLIVKEQLHPVLKDLQQSGLSHQDLGDYALAVHARDVNAKGINSGFNNAEIDDVIRNLGSEKMEAARVKLLGVNNNVLDMLSSGGIIDDAQIAGMREKWPNYVSLFRSFDDDKIDFAGGMGKALANATSPIKKLEGSNRAVVDPMESIIKNIFKATNTVDKNKVGTQIANLAKKDTEGAFIKQVADNDETSRMNVVSVMDNGKKVKYEVPPEVYRTLTNMDKESSNTLIKILQKPASLLRAGATLTPEFSLRNPLRDVPNAFVVSKSGFNPITDFTYGLVQSIGKGRTIKIGKKEFKAPGEVYKQFIKENGGYGNIISMDRKLHQETLKKALTEVNTNYVDVLDPKTYKSLMKKFANPLNVLRTIADVSETATKVGEFRAATRKGASPQEAAYRARDIMDFARAGISVREANKVVAFLNANIQGKSKLLRSFRENPVKFTGKAVAAVTIPTIGVRVAQETYANDKQREIIDDAPRWLKDTFYLMPIPGTNQIARIPKPFDLAFAFSNTIERTMDYFYKNDKDAFDGWIKQGFSQASIPAMLTGLAPIMEGMADYSFFRQAPIIPQREKGVEFPDQHDVNTTETAKFIGKQVNKVTGGVGAFKNFGSPRIVDNTIRGFTAGLGTYATSVIDIFAKGGEDEPVRPAKSIDQMPVARAFLVNQSSSGESLDKLYNTKEKLTKARGSAKQNQKPFADEGKYQAVNNVTKSIADLSKQIRFIENNPTMSAKEKKSTLDRLINQRNSLSRQAMENLKNME